MFDMNIKIVIVYIITGLIVAYYLHKSDTH
jgi:hypothetical protein